MSLIRVDFIVVSLYTVVSAAQSAGVKWVVECVILHDPETPWVEVASSIVHWSSCKLRGPIA